MSDKKKFKELNEESHKYLAQVCRSFCLENKLLTAYYLTKAEQVEEKMKAIMGLSNFEKYMNSLENEAKAHGCEEGSLGGLSSSGNWKAAIECMGVLKSLGDEIIDKM